MKPTSGFYQNDLKTKRLFIMILEDEKEPGTEAQEAVENAATEAAAETEAVVEAAAEETASEVEAVAETAAETAAETVEAVAAVVEETAPEVVAVAETVVEETAAPVVESAPAVEAVAEDADDVIEEVDDLDIDLDIDEPTPAVEEVEPEEDEEEVDIPVFDPVMPGSLHDDFNWQMDKRGAIAYTPEDRRAYLKKYEVTMTEIEENAVIRGRVSAISGGDVVLDINHKSDGLISMNEFRDTPDLKAGDEVGSNNSAPVCSTSSRRCCFRKKPSSGTPKVSARSST